MPVPLKNIKGIMLKEKNLVNAQLTLSTFKHFEGYNDALSQQGEVKIGMNREKLAMTILHWKGTLDNGDSLSYSRDLKDCYELADAIISHESEIIERSQ